MYKLWPIIVKSNGLRLYFNGFSALGSPNCVVFDGDGKVVVRRSYSSLELQHLETARAAGKEYIFVKSSARLLSSFSPSAPQGGRGRLRLVRAFDQLAFAF